MPETVEAARFKIPVVADFSRLRQQMESDLRGDVAAAAVRVGTTAGKIAGQRTGSELVKALKLAYKTRIAEAREELARGLIDKKEFERRGQEAGKALNRAILKEMDRLGRVEGARNLPGQKQFVALADQLKDVGEEGGKTLSRLSTGISKFKVAAVAAIALVAGSRLVGWLRDAASAGIDLARSYLRLSATARLFGVDQQTLNNLAVKGRTEFGLTAQVANELAAASAKLAARSGDVTKSQELMARALDLGAAQGLTAEQTTQSLEQTLRGLDEGTDKLLQKNPQQIFQAYAASIGKTVGKLSDAERKQALVNALLDAGARVQGEYGRQLGTDIGRLQLWNALLTNSKQRIGTALIPILADFAKVLSGPVKSATDGFVAFLQMVQIWGVKAAVRLQEIKVGLMDLVLAAQDTPILGRILTIGGESDTLSREAVGRARAELQRLRAAADEEVQRIVSGNAATPSGKTTTPPPEPDADAAARLEERKKLLERLRDEVARILGDTTEVALYELDKLEAEAHEKFGSELPKEVADGLATIRANIKREGVFSALQEDFDRISEWAASPQKVEALDSLRMQFEAEMEALDPKDPRRQDYLKWIQKVADAERDAADATEAAAEADDAADRRQRLQDLRDQARTLEENVRAALQLAEAFGLVNSDAADALATAVQLGGAVARIAGGDLTAIPSAIGAAASLISDMFGGSNEEARQRHREAIASQASLIQALYDLHDTVISDLTSGEKAAAVAAARSVLDPANQSPLTAGLGFQRIEDPEALRQLQIIQDQTGGDFISDNNLVDLDKLEQAAKAFQETALGLFGDDVRGRLDAFDYTLNLLGDSAGTAEERVQRLIKVLQSIPEAAGFAAEFQRIYQTEGADAALEYVRGLGVALASGDTSSLNGGVFDGLTGEEAQRIIDETVARLTGSGGGITGGGSAGSRLNVNLTEVQGSEIISQLGTQTYYLAQIYDVLAAGGIDPALLGGPITPPSRAQVIGSGGSTTSIHVDRIMVSIPGDGGRDAYEQGREAGRGVADGLEEAAARKRRAGGRLSAPRVEVG